ncbi:MAG: NADH-quinone oxidoreductase subunit H [Actinobacteria bacterium]|nr:NADH-quinone oxidoreductase subunit H [Actinomycetota bacterium]
MLILLKKIGYIILILGVNLYIISFLNNKIISRIELRRGYKGYKTGVIGFPFSSSLKYIAKGIPFSVWDILIFILPLLLWSVVPISFNLYIFDSQSNLFIALMFYMLILIFKNFSVSYSKYNFVISDFLRRTAQMFTLIIPLLFCVLSIIIINRSLDFKAIVNAQYQYWNIIYQPAGFIIFFLCILLQIKLLNLSERNQFLISGNTGKEGEGITKLCERFSGYLSIFFLIILLNNLYLGGWQKLYMIRGDVMVAVKFYVILILLILFERSISNISSINKLINLNYKLLLPLSAANLLITVIFFILRNVYHII